MAQLPPSQNDHRRPWRPLRRWWLCVPLLTLGLVLVGLYAVVPPARRAEPVPQQDQPVQPPSQPVLNPFETPEPATEQDEPAGPFLTQHCQGCHAGARPKGKFRLDALTQDFEDKATRERWLAVLEQVESGAMPPKEKPRPPQKDVTVVADWIRLRVEAAEGARLAKQGRVPIRRLNREIGSASWRARGE